MIAVLVPKNLELVERFLGILAAFSFLIIGTLVIFPSTALAHGGGLNSEGCHNNRKTGDYHCHRSGYKPRSSPPVVLELPEARARRAKAICTELGFTVGTTKHEECILLVLDRKAICTELGFTVGTTKHEECILLVLDR